MINTAQLNNNQERENSNTNEIGHFKMISFIEIKYPTYALQVVSIISDSDLENDWFHWYGAPKDFDYEKIHPDVIKAFMG